MNCLKKWLRRLRRHDEQRSTSEAPTSQTSTATATRSEDFATILEKIKGKGWWQGSIIPAADLANAGHPCDEANYWIVASQTCNLYNYSIERVPVFEIVGARQVDECDPAKSKGDDPRALHVQAQSDQLTIALDVDIQKRKWLPRECLAQLPAPEYAIKDAPRQNGALANQWLDNLAGWMGRSYTRVALPDEFNTALADSKLRQVLEDKLTKDKDALYGIYLTLEPDSDDPWEGALGLMPPPYILGVTLLVHETHSPKDLRDKLVKQIFKDQVQDPGDASKKLTRSELAKRKGIRIVEAGIEAKSVSDVSLQEMKSLIRYSMVDHLSQSSFTA
ncbi:hypothetical protein LDP08_14215 [Ralstonia pseudosolanacearum]|uniref:hypothetical protein n=1 Tax=Ralstonia pseudosolanacearum TaxID=1310165 RepID=UPI003CE7CC29